MIFDHEFSLRRCPTKVLHARAHLPQRDESMARWLRDESGKVHALAGQLFPDAVEVTARDQIEAENETRLLLKNGKTVRGARFSTETVTCRVDFVTRENDVLRLYQVVSRCIKFDASSLRPDLAGDDGRIMPEWRSVLERLALRCAVVQQLWPDSRIQPFLVAPLHGGIAKVEGLHGCFGRNGDRWIVTNAAKAAQASTLLKTFNVWPECSGLMAEVMRQAEALDETLKRPISPAIGYHCVKCEWNIPGRLSGYDQCWGPLARVSPHMFDLYYLWDLQETLGGKRYPVASRLAREGIVTMNHLPRELMTGKRGPRQLMQLEGTLRNCEILKPELKSRIAEAVYPIFFLDLESVVSALPVFSWTKSNSKQLVQFSVHRRDYPGADLVHVEFLHTDRCAPNRAFLRALRAAVGDRGNVYTWTDYEVKSFRSLQADIIGENEDDEDGDLRWLTTFLYSSRRIVDQNEWALSYWFNPLLGGRTKLKIALPAAWSVDSPVKHRAPYAAFPADQDPYEVLRRLGQVSDGGAAMSGYVAMQAAEGELRDKLAAELRKYCCVDTLSQAFLWDYWEWKLSLPNLAANARAVQEEALAGV